jgi:hypothetical protein
MNSHSKRSGGATGVSTTASVLLYALDDPATLSSSAYTVYISRRCSVNVGFTAASDTNAIELQEILA